jgi:hypothetical protein
MVESFEIAIARRSSALIVVGTAHSCQAGGLLAIQAPTLLNYSDSLNACGRIGMLLKNYMQMQDEGFR